MSEFREGAVVALAGPLRDARHALVLGEVRDGVCEAVLLTEDAAVGDEPIPAEAGAPALYVLPDARLLMRASEMDSVVGQLDSAMLETVWRGLVLADTRRHFRAKSTAESVAGDTRVRVSGRVYDDSDVCALVDSSLDFWLTSGRYHARFEKQFARFLGVKHVLPVNSGSSANLLAVATLTSPKLGDRALRPGDEVISVAAGFPTTVNPLLQYRLVPVFVDIELPTYNVDPARLEAAVSDKTRAIMLAHTLGNPFNLDAVKAVAEKHDLWLIEDCCDALGSTYNAQKVGTFGDLATFSFYPAHHITMGEGGAVVTNSAELKRIAESFRDWGRDCWCDTGCDNTCRKRYAWQLGDLPAGYDHKYTYSHVGYNLKITDMQAAIGCAQMEHLPGFIERRKHNFRYLRDALEPLSGHLLLPEPTAKSEPSWFGFPLMLKEGERGALLTYLEEKRIDSRLLFGGNLIRQPYFSDQRYRVHGDLPNTDRTMNDALWLGVYPGLDSARIDSVVDALNGFFVGGWG